MAILAAAMALATEELSEALLTAALLPAELEADELTAEGELPELTVTLAGGADGGRAHGGGAVG